jgi:redox-sensing transcriptional repressor
MSDGQSTPDATLYRLSLYHCFLSELLRVGAPKRITSRQLADELSLKEETVRRDISFVGDIGRPGAGYEPAVLLGRLAGFLGLVDEYPIVMIGTARMLEALHVVFPCERYGVKPAGLFSEIPEDAGQVVDALTVQHVTDITRIDPEAGIKVALVACSPGWVQVAIDLLAGAGITGVLLITPIIKVRRPEGMTITQLRMPCDLKSLACKCSAQPGAVGAR